MGKIISTLMAMSALALTAGCSHQETPAPVVSPAPTTSASAPVVPQESRQRKMDFIASLKAARMKNAQAAQQQKP